MFKLGYVEQHFSYKNVILLNFFKSYYDTICKMKWFLFKELNKAKLRFRIQIWSWLGFSKFRGFSLNPLILAGFQIVKFTVGYPSMIWRWMNLAGGFSGSLLISRTLFSFETWNKFLSLRKKLNFSNFQELHMSQILYSSYEQKI